MQIVIAREIFGADYLPYRQEKQRYVKISTKERAFFAPHSLSFVTLNTHIQVPQKTIVE